MSFYLEDGSGEGFQTNVWRWRPLWDFVRSIGAITDMQHEQGLYNEGLKIPQEQARKIAQAIRSMQDASHNLNLYRLEEFASFCEHCDGGFSIW